MNRGYTIVELIVVVAVLSILITMSAFGMSAYRNSAADAQAESMVKILTSGLERYYSRFNEYPTAEQLFGGTPNGLPPSNYNAAAQLLDMSASNFSTQSIKFMPCTVPGGMYSGCTYSDYSGWVAGIDKVKYISKSAGETNLEKQVFVGSPNGPNTALANCEIVIRSSIHHGAVYVLTYWSRDESKVKFVKSDRGEVNMFSPEAGQCVFTAP